uniref:Uncharacterized protein n=1 Tax=Stegastes partitus TaxID=144197 RepID=A0A3B4ZYW7_9TELE
MYRRGIPTQTHTQTNEKRKKKSSWKTFLSNFELNNQAVISGMVNCLYTVVCFLIPAGSSFTSGL